MTIKGLYRKVGALNVPDVATESFATVTEQYSDENKKQMYDGLDRYGADFKQYYSQEYAIGKNEMNPRPGYGNPDLYLTGSFYRGIRTTIQNGRVITNSSDEKNDKLVKKYDPFGLGGVYRVEFVSTNLRPAFMAEIKQRIFK